MYKDHYISVFGKLAPSEAWKAETLAKMHALEKQQEQSRAGLDGACVAAGAAPGKRPKAFAVLLRRAALPIAAAAMLAILPITTLRGCGASGSGIAPQMESAAMDSCAPAAADTAPRDRAAGAQNGAPAQAPSGAAAPQDIAPHDAADGEGSVGFDSAQSMAATALAPEEVFAGSWEESAAKQREFEIAYGGKPFRELELSEIRSASVSLTPPDITLEIPDMEKLLGLLQDVVVYGRDDSYSEYSGQGVTFLLTFEDGTQTRIMAFEPFLVIDGVGYRTKSAPCEALSRYANALRESGEAVTILSRPPALSVIGTLDETNHAALLGGYAWKSKNADGTFTETKADSAHPLACRAQLQPALEMEHDHTLKLLFPEGALPDEIVRVRCWSDASWGSSTAQSETVRVLGSAAEGGYAIEVKPGGYIYEVTARWDDADGYGGTASYAFYVKGIDEPE